MEEKRVSLNYFIEKYAEEKVQLSAIQRSLRAVEGKLQQTLQEKAAIEKDQVDLQKKITTAEAECQAKIAQLQSRITKFEDTLAKLKQNRDEYKAKLEETVQIVKKRNEMIYALQAERDELTSSLQETSSGKNRCEKHNKELVTLAEELVVAYEKKGFGATVLQGEPFTQIKKVELEKFIQLYRDRIENDDLELIKPAN